MKHYIKKWIIVSDLQIPYEDVRSLAAVEKYMAAHRWDGLIYIGDLLDFDAISSFNIGSPGLTEGKRLSADFSRASKMIDRHIKLVRGKHNKDAKIVYLEGNHEERVERFLNAFPAFKGYFSVPKALDLAAKDIEWVPAWSTGATYKVGKATFLHGNYTNQYHPAKMAAKYGDSVFYGHTHDMMSHAVANHLHPDKVHVGQSIGCLCERDQAYMKGKPSNWQQGFMVLYLLPDGNYTYYTPRIFNHKFVGPDGVLYEG